MAWQPHQRVQPEAYCYLGHRNVVAKHQPATYQGAKRALSCLRERKGEKRETKRREREGGWGGGGADIEGRLGTQGDFCSLKQLLEETSLLFCFLLTPFLLFVLAKDMYKNVFWYVFSLGLYQNISFVSVHGTFFFTSCLCKLVLLSDHVRDQRRHNLWTYLSQHLMLAWHVYFFTRWNFLWFMSHTSEVRGYKQYNTFRDKQWKTNK